MQALSELKDADGNSAVDSMEKSVAIPFIRFEVESAQFTLEKNAVDFLKSIEGRVSVIAVAGKYRTGKSYLLNQLFLK